MTTTVRTVRSDAIDLLRSLPDESVDVIPTDPVYGTSYQSNHRKEGKTRPLPGDWNVQIGAFLIEAARVLKPGGAAYICCRWDVYPLWYRTVPPELKRTNLIIWDKGNHTAGDLEGNFGFRYEGVFFLTKDRHRLRGKRWPNLWDEFPRVPMTRLTHPQIPTEKPVGLMQRMIESSSDPGGFVVDPYCGSGSTGEAAIAAGRRVLLGDIDPLAVEVTCRRLGLEIPEADAAQPPPIVVPEGEDDVCWDALDGLHPEDIAEVARWLKRNRTG